MSSYKISLDGCYVGPVGKLVTTDAPIDLDFNAKQTEFASADVAFDLKGDSPKETVLGKAIKNVLVPVTTGIVANLITPHIKP